MSDRPRDDERVARITKTLVDQGLDGMVCAHPANVLMLSGYWPVVGTAVAIATRDSQISLVVPEDEERLAENSWADVIRTFPGGSLDSLDTITESICPVLSDLRRALDFRPGTTLGVEGGASFNAAGYASTFSYGAGIQGLLAAAFPFIVTLDATNLLARLRSALTASELATLRRACDMARQAFTGCAGKICAGMREFEVAARLRYHLAAGERCDGFAYCMSGPNSAEAYAAFQQSRGRAIEAGDFVLVHCNSYCDGFWTDITRTYTIGKPDAEKAAIIDAVMTAGREALSLVRPGARAADVDHAARDLLTRRGYGRAFKHPTGHGVGFAAINHNALPRIHPLSREILEPGMVFNLEPAVYIPKLGGMRHCDMIAVTETGAEVLTPFDNQPANLILA